MTTRSLILLSLLSLTACDLEPKYIGDPAGSSSQAAGASTSDGAEPTDPGAGTTTDAEPDDTTTTTTGVDMTTTGGDTTTTTTTTTTGSESTSHGTTAEPDEPAPLTCGLPSCPPVVLNCDDCLEPEEAPCVWQALADNASVELRTEAYVAQFGVRATRTRWIPLGDAERRVLLQHEPFEGGEGREPLGESLGLRPPEVCTLAPAEFFAGCLLAYNSNCYEAGNWFTDCAPVDPVVCPLP